MKYLFVILSLIVLFSCSKKENRACWKTTGKTETRRLILEPFRTLKVEKNVTVFLMQDTLEFALIKGGENVLNFIDFNQKNQRLQVSNRNKCAFLRSAKKKVEIEIHYKKLDSLFMNQTEPIVMLNTLINNHFYASFIESSSTLYADVNVAELALETVDTWADFQVKGEVDIARFVIKGNCYLNAINLNVKNKTTCLNWSVGNVWLGVVEGALKVETKNKGNVYYQGYPTAIDFTKNGTGDLIRQ